MVIIDHTGRVRKTGNWRNWKLSGSGTVPPPTAGEPLLPAAWVQHRGRGDVLTAGELHPKAAPLFQKDLQTSVAQPCPPTPWDSMALVQFAFDTSEATEVTKPLQWSFVIWILCVLQKGDKL